MRKDLLEKAEALRLRLEANQGELSEKHERELKDFLFQLNAYIEAALSSADSLRRWAQQKESEASEYVLLKNLFTPKGKKQSI